MQPLKYVWLLLTLQFFQSITADAQEPDSKTYSITLCADIPDNSNARKVFHNSEPGHVFIILEERDIVSGDQKSLVWGFYPRRPVSAILFRSAKSKLVDNSNREYDASVCKSLTKEQFIVAMKNAYEFTQRKYHLNKYNCYDYAVEVFNSVPGTPAIPLTHIKFPFVFGRGGSPCALYRDLEKLQPANNPDQFIISLHPEKAPISYNNREQTLAKSKH